MDAARRIEKLEILDEDVARERLAVDPADRAAGIVVDGHLISCAAFAAAQKDAAIDAEIDARLERDLDIAEGLVGEQDAAIAGAILRAGDRPVLDAPAAAAAMQAGGAVRRQRARVPAGKAVPVEDGAEAGIVELLDGEFGGPDRQYH